MGYYILFMQNIMLNNEDSITLIIFIVIIGHIIDIRSSQALQPAR